MNSVTIAAFITIFLILDLQYYATEAKIFTRCQLAKELIKNDFPRTFLSNLDPTDKSAGQLIGSFPFRNVGLLLKFGVCLVENESGRSTSKVMQQPNLSVSYGLFQINNKTWCRKGRKGGICNVKCEDFLNDDIQDDAKCAKTIFNQKGFQAWSGWVSKCRGRNLPDVSRC